jgi:tetratricopeptide (TPR) repeat protein
VIRPLLTLVALTVAVVAIAIEAVHVYVWSIREASETAYYDGDFEAALAGYERVLDLHPSDPWAYTDPADSISQYLDSGAGQYLPLAEFETLAEKGVGYYLHAIALGPPGAWSYGRLAVVADALGRVRARDDELNLTRLTGTASSLGAEDRLCEAAWVQAVHIEPRNFYYRDFLGDFYLRRGFVSLALEHFRMAVRLHPVLDAHYYLSDFASASPAVLEAVEEGVQDALAAGDTDVTEYDIHRFLAALYVKLGRIDDARESLESAAEVAPLPHAVHVQIGQLMFRGGDEATALESFRHAAEIEPGYSRAWLRMAVLLSRMQRHDEAVDAAYRARSLAPGDYSTTSALARILKAAGQTEPAIEILETLIRSNRDKPLPYMTLIELYESRGELVDAERVARRLVANFPDEALYQQQLRQLQDTLEKDR